MLHTLSPKVNPHLREDFEHEACFELSGETLLKKGSRLGGLVLD